jgi:tRNA dimethylallyltransferase
MSANKVILLVGPTCVGKTGASVALARMLGTEIISADSMQIYRHMDIGTEKPTPAQMKAAKHHMIDIVEPSETYSSGRYIEAIKPIIEGLHKKGRVPIVTGGTGLYIKSMTRGLFRGPSADWELREELKKEGSVTLYERLRALDPETAGELEPNDRRRVVRALEVCLKTGRKMSELKKSRTSPLPYGFIKIGFSRDRKELYEMIEGRVDGMMERGLLEEVRRVLEMEPAKTPMQAIGYKEIAAHLRGEYPLEEAVRLIKRNSKRYAKRQFTWFSKEEGLRWVDITGIQDPEKAVGKILPVLRAEGISLPDKKL